MRTSTRLHAELTAIIDRAYEAADQADGSVIRALLDDLTGTGLDPHTAAFLGQAHQLALNTTAALTSVLDTHRFGSRCSECGTSDPCRTIRGLSEIFVPIRATCQSYVCPSTSPRPSNQGLFAP